MKTATPTSLPNTADISRELDRVKYNKRYRSVMRSTIFTLITVAATAVLIAMLFLPVLQIYGSSMTPTLENGEIVCALRSSDWEQGDVVAFYYNNKILIKRVIALPGDWVDINPEGAVSVNGVVLHEPYVTELAYGETDIELPYQVPDGRIFVLGDHRSVSIDSRSTTVGCIAQEQIVGKLVLRVWPLKAIGKLN